MQWPGPTRSGRSHLMILCKPRRAGIAFPCDSCKKYHLEWPRLQSFTSSQNPDQTDHNHQCNRKKYDPAVMMEVPFQEPWINPSSEFCDDKNTEAVLGDRQRNRRRDEYDFPPPRAQEKMRQNHGRHEQH